MLGITAASTVIMRETPFVCGALKIGPRAQSKLIVPGPTRILRPMREQTSILALNGSYPV